MTIKTFLKSFPLITAALLWQTASGYAHNSCEEKATHGHPCHAAEKTPMPLPCPAHNNNFPNSWGVQGAIVEGGYTSIGIVNYGECHSFGITASGFVKTNGSTSSVFKPGIFGGPRFRIKENTYFACGLDLATQFGKSNGSHISSAIGVGPYISIEHHFTPKIMASIWINPYFYERIKVSGQSTTTHNFMTGGIGFSYLF